MALINKKEIIAEDELMGVNIDNFLNAMNTADEIINDEIYDDNENIDKIRKDLKEGIIESQKQAEDIRNDINENKKEKIIEIKEKISVSFIVSKLKEELEKERNLSKKDRSINIKKLERNINLVEDSLYLNIFKENQYFSQEKIDKEKIRKIIKETNRKLSLTNKYQFCNINEIKNILKSSLNDECKSKINKFLYNFCKFILKCKLDEYSVYISCIINNIKYIKLFPDLEQNKIIIESITNIIETKC